jgi:hypothetical protein
MPKRSLAESSLERWLLGVALGMSAREVESRFRPGARGSFRREGDGFDLRLHWSAAPPTSESPSAVDFEFHGGLLMAIRARLPPGHPLAAGPPLRVLDAEVEHRTVTADGAVEWEVLVRDCDAHAAEVERLLSTAGADADAPEHGRIPPTASSR